ncbi:hypothetical protein SAMN05216276_1005123 [Streptosporangium subroseum]|uniref:Uncharacterized protein n=1 Tax=Streptosporangium subroseum TaxID=106412 RepID=A0A239CDS5_9ACTN|nr:hypothetical protein [Streptosporangium subroseum]SNS17791.1 hypothetical protein SAMN05216276_1005123 [Streptosporangium subroseum]
MPTQDENLAASISAPKNAVTGPANRVKEPRAEFEVMKGAQARMPEIPIELQRRVSSASE